jgi:hypothetical protein
MEREEQSMSESITPYTDRMIDFVEEGVIDAKTLAIMVAKWMTEDDIEGMLDANELTERFEEEE